MTSGILPYNTIENGKASFLCRKEFSAVVKSIRNCRHCHLGTHLRNVRDSFLDSTLTAKFRVQKLSCQVYSFEAVYRPSQDNVATDSLSPRFLSETVCLQTSKEIYNYSCHPAFSRMLHFLRSKNLFWCFKVCLQRLSSLCQMQTHYTTCPREISSKPRFQLKDRTLTLGDCCHQYYETVIF